MAIHTRSGTLPHPVRLPAKPESAGVFLPTLRGLLARAASSRAPGSWLLCLRSSDRVRRFVDDSNVSDHALRGVATPEQVIRIKARPCLLPSPDVNEPQAWRDASQARIDEFISWYDGYFAHNNARVGGMRQQLDPLPRVFLIPGHGLVGVGRTATEAAVAADVAEVWIDAVLDAEAVGRFNSITEADHFDMEYWSLEQAKLSRAPEKSFVRRVVLVTGAGGAIGAATARAFAAQGAEVALLDLDDAAAIAACNAIGGQALPLGCDMTDPAAVEAAFDQVVARFGGIDVVVSNAGSAEHGALAGLSDVVLRRSFELNFFAHQTVARLAVRVMRLQAHGGVLLFNVSKQAINPGASFGAYGTSKAALLALLRQYALEHGVDGIRVNGINPDRIRSGLLSPALIQERAAARGVDEETYLRGNLLREEVRAEDVAQAFVASALLERTTGNIITVDGGNVAAMLR